MASRSLGTLTLDLVLKLGGFTKGADQATRKFDRMSNKLKRQAKGLTSAFKGLGVALASGFAIQRVIQATIAQENAIAQLEAVLKSTSGVAGQTSKELQDMASSLQAVTTYGDEATIGMQAVLLTFTQIRGDQFDQATVAVLDMATALKLDLKQAALQVGKALNDPKLGITALSRAGIQFSEENQRLIRNLVDTGQVAKAQGIILKELEVQFGGSAKAARETFGGALTGVRNAFGDLMEGSTGLPEATRALNEFADLLSDPAVKQGADNFLGGLLKGFGGLVKLISQTTQGWRLIFGGELSDEVVNLDNRIRDLIAQREKLQGFWGGLIGPQAAKQAAEIQEEIDRLVARMDELIFGAKETEEAVQKALDTEPRKATAAEIKEIEKIWERNRTAAEKYAAAVDELNSKRLLVGSEGKPLIDDETYNRELARLTAERDKAIGGTASASGETVAQATTSIQNFVTQLEEQRATLSLTAEELVEYEILHGKLADSIKVLGEEGGRTEERLLRLAEAVSLEKATAEITDQIEKLKEQAATYGLTTEQAFAYSVVHGEIADKLALTGDRAEELRVQLLEAHNALATVIEDQAKAAERESIFKATRTDAEKYEESLKRLKELYADSEDEETYGRAVAQATIAMHSGGSAAEDYRARLAELEAQLSSGTLTQEAYEAAVEGVDEAFGEAGKKAAEVFRDEAMRNTQGIIAEFLVDPFDEGIEGLVSSFGDMLKRMAAQALAAKIAEAMFGGIDDILTQIGGAFAGGAGGGAGGAGGGWGKFFSELGASFLKTYETGGYTGDGGSKEPAGIVHKGEYVVSADRVKAPGVLPILREIQEGPGLLMQLLQTRADRAPIHRESGEPSLGFDFGFPLQRLQQIHIPFGLPTSTVASDSLSAQAAHFEQKALGIDPDPSRPPGLLMQLLQTRADRAPIHRESGEPSLGFDFGFPLQRLQQIHIPFGLPTSTVASDSLSAQAAHFEQKALGINLDPSRPPGLLMQLLQTRADRTLEPVFKLENLTQAIGQVQQLTGSPIVSGWPTGGYTGPGGKSEPAGIVHRGEFVISADRVRAPGVLPLLAAIQSGAVSEDQFKHLYQVFPRPGSSTLERFHTSTTRDLARLYPTLPGFMEGGLVGSIIPMASAAASIAKTEALAGGGSERSAMSVSQNFAISAPQGTVSSATQQQIAAAAARGLAMANRRNN